MLAISVLTRFRFTVFGLLLIGALFCVPAMQWELAIAQDQNAAVETTLPPGVASAPDTPAAPTGLVGSIMTLLMLTLLQAVLGFDNLLYISIESKRVAEDQQQKVRMIGIVLAIVLRIALLFVVMKAIDLFEAPFFSIPASVSQFVTGDFNVESVVVLIGGAFIIYTAIKEITHMLVVHDLGHGADKKTRSVGTAIFWIVVMNLVFSFDSILSAMALTRVFWVMAAAIILSGIMMIVLANQVSEFLNKNRMYEVLGLFILFIVGIMLLSEGGHKAGLSFFTHHVEAMPKSTFYFVLVVLVLIDIVQGRYQKKLIAEQNAARNAQL